MSRIVISTLALFMVLTVAMCDTPPKYVEMSASDWRTHTNGGSCSAGWKDWVRDRITPNGDDPGAYRYKFYGGKLDIGQDNIDDLVDEINRIYPPAENQVEKGIMILNDFNVEIKGEENKPVDVYITYYVHSAGYLNRLLMYRAMTDKEFESNRNNEQYDRHRGIVRYVAYEHVNSLSHDCLKAGMTVRRQLYPGKYGFALEADYHNNLLNTFYSDWNLQHRDARGSLRSSDNLGHATSAELNFGISEEQKIDRFQLLGFEDQIDGDDDYNDVMFSVYIPGGEFSDTPIVDELIYACVDVTRVPQYSYSEGMCTGGEKSAYGYLELTSYEQDSPHFLSPAGGWNYAKYDDETKDMIRRTPEYHEKCIGFVTPNGHTDGYNYDIVAWTYSPANDFVECNSGEPRNDDRFVPITYCNDDKRPRQCEDGENVKRDHCFNVKDRLDKILITRNLDCETFECVKEKPRVENYPADSDVVATLIYPQTSHITYDSDDTTFKMDLTLQNIEDVGDVVVNVAYVIYDPGTNTPYNFDLDNFNLGSGYKVRTSVYRYDGSRLITLKSFYDEDEFEPVTFNQHGEGEFKIDDMERITSHNYGWNAGAFKILTIIHGKTSYERGVSEENVPKLYSRSAAVALFSTRNASGFTQYGNLHFRSVNSVNAVSTMKKMVGEACIIAIGIDKGDDCENLGEKKRTVQLSMAYADGNEVTIYAIGRDKFTATEVLNNPPQYRGDVHLYFSADDTSQYVVDLNSSWNDPDGDKIVFELGEEIPSGYISALDEGSTITIKLDDHKNPTSGPSTLKYTATDGCSPVTGTINLYFSCEDNVECLGPDCRDIVYELHRCQEVELWDRLKDGAFFHNNNNEEKYDWTYTIKSFTKSTECYIEDENFEVDAEIDENFKSKFVFHSDIIEESQFRITYEATTNHPKEPHILEGTSDISVTCDIIINILPNNHPPTIIDDQVGYSFEDQTFYFNIDEDSVQYEEETGTEPERRLMLSYVSETDEEKGSLRCCYDDECVDCSEMEDPQFVEQMIFVPLDNDYGDCPVETTELESDCLYKTVTFCLHDAVHVYERDLPRRCTEIEYPINIIPVNDKPEIEIIFDEGNMVRTIKKGGEETIHFKVSDIDTLPSELSAFVNVRLFSGDYNIYECSGVDGEVCEKEIRSGDQISSFNYEEENCGSQEELKKQRGQDLEGCYAEFKFKFVPTKDSYSLNNKVLITFTIEGYDGFDRSDPKYVSYIVEADNLPPTVVSPDVIESATRTINVELDDEHVTVWDDAPPTSHKLIELEMRVIEGNGEFILPDSEHAGWECNVVGEDDDGNEDENQEETGKALEASQTIRCGKSDYNTINIWLRQLRFNLIDGDEATVEFVVHDGGFPNVSPDSIASEPSTTTFVYEEVVSVPPVKNNSTLTIVAASVGAAAAVALGLLVFFLRKAIKPPADDYFNIGADTVSGTPTNPIYSAQTVENVSPYYRGA